MIPRTVSVAAVSLGKPRASGDDPEWAQTAILTTS